MAPTKSSANVQREQEIEGLINAVKEHKKFKQLACYSIQALDKAIDPQANRNTWRESVALAIRLNAAAVICDILQRHPGHENVLLVCTECLRKLAIDKTNAVVIAEQNAVPYLLGSIQANPDLPEEVLHMAMSLLNELCTHAKVSAMVLNEATLRSVLGVLKTNRDPLVLNSCINVIDKISKLQKNDVGIRGSVVDDQVDKLLKMVNESCAPAMLKALETISKGDMIDGMAEDLVVNITKVFARLVSTSAEAEKQLKAAGGLDSYLMVMDAFRDSDRVARASSKLVSKMMGGNIGELMATLQGGGISAAARERILGLISTMAMDAGSMDEIMKSGGVSAMIGSMESSMSTRALEETARTIARLASSPKNVPMLVEGGALSQIAKVLKAGGNVEMQASMVLALARIVSASPSALDSIVADSRAIACLIATLAANPAHATLTKATLDIFARFTAGNLSKVDVGSMTTTVLTVMQKLPDGDPAVAQCLSTLGHILKAEGGERLGVMLASGTVPIVLRALSSPAAMEHAPVALAALGLLGGIARGEGLEALRTGGAFASAVELLGAHAEDIAVRAATAELIQRLATDDLISSFSKSLADFATRLQLGQTTDGEMRAIPQLALGLGALAMIPENIPKIQAAGGLVPMLTLMGAVTDMKECPNRGQLLSTFCSCLSEVVGAVESKVLLKSSVAILTKHSGMTEACGAALRLIRVAIEADTDDHCFAIALIECSGIDAIATQIRLHPSDAPELLGHALAIYSGLCVGDNANERAMDIVQRSGRQLCNCLDENFTAPSSTLASLIPVLQVLETCALSREGRIITSKLGAVKSVLGILEAASQLPDVVMASSRALTAIVTGSDVQRVVERLQGRVDELRGANPDDETALFGVTDDVKKLGLLMMCGDFSQVIQAGGGIQALVDIVIMAESIQGESAARDGLVKSCITAFGRAAAGNMTVRNAVFIVPALIAAMIDDPSTEVLLAIGALAACDSTILSALVQQGAIDALVPVLHGLDATADRAAISACLKALAAFSLSPEGVQRVVRCGGLAFVVEHLREDLADGGSANAITAAVALLRNVSAHGGDGSDMTTTLVSAGVLGLVQTSLSYLQHSAASDTSGISDTTALVSLQQLLTSMCTGATTQEIVSSGIVQQVDSLLTFGSVYLSNVQCVLATNSFISSLTSNGLGQDLKSLGADGMLIRAMNANSMDVEVAKACAQTVGALGGGGTGTFITILDQSVLTLARMEAALAAMKVGGGDSLFVKESAEARSGMQLLSNLILLEGAVDQAGADRIMDLATCTLRLLAAVGSSSRELDSATDAVNAVALTLMGRLAGLNHIDLNTEAMAVATNPFFTSDDVTDTVLASAVACYGGLASSSRGVQSIAKHGMVATIQKKIHQRGKVGAGASSGQLLVASVAAAALDTLRTQAVSSAVALVNSEGGAAALASILSGIAGDTSHPKVLSITLGQIVAEQGGLQVLLDILCELASAGISSQRKLADSIVSCILEQRDSGKARLEVTTPAQAIALVAAAGFTTPLSAARVVPQAVDVASAVSPASAKLAARAAADAADTAIFSTPSSAAVVFLEGLVMAPTGCLIMACVPSVLEAAVASIAHPNLAVANSCVGIMAHLSSLNDGAINERLIDCKVTAKIATMLKTLQQPSSSGEPANVEGKGRGFVDCAMYTVATLLATLGVDACALDRDTARSLQTLAPKLASNPYAAAQCAKALQLLSKAMAASADTMLEESLLDLAKLPAASRAWLGVSDASVYYYNSITSESTWSKPEAYESLLSDLSNIAELIQTVGSLESIDPKIVGAALVPFLSSHARDRQVSTFVVDFLVSACSSQESAQYLGSKEPMGDLIVVLDSHLISSEELAVNIAEIAHALSHIKQFKAAVSNTDYLAVMNRACLTYITNRSLVWCYLRTIGNAAAGHAANVASCLAAGVPSTLRSALETHNLKDIAAVCFFVLEIILNAMDEFGDAPEEPFGDDEEREKQKVAILTEIATEMLSAIAVFGVSSQSVADGEEPWDFFLRAVRCMGSMSLVDECIVLLVEGGATRHTVAGMRKWRDSIPAMCCAIELLSNFGAIEDDELDAAMTKYLMAEEALQAVIEAMQRFDTVVTVLLVSYEALYNIGNDSDAAGMLVVLGIVRIAFTTIQNFDYEKLLVAQVMKFLSVMTYDPRAVKEVGELGWLPIVFQAMKTRVENEEFILDGLMAVCNSVPDPRNQRTVLENRQLLVQLLELLNQYETSVDVVTQVVITCIRLSTNEEVSILMAAEGMPFFMRTTSNIGMSETDVLVHLFELLFFLAFVKENIKVIVQHGGIKVLCGVMEVEKYQRDVQLMSKAVGMMDNVVSSDEEFASIVAEKGGRSLLEQLRSLHGGNTELLAATSSAILSLDSMLKTKEKDTRSTRSGTRVEIAGAESEPTEDPLVKHRQLLMTGAHVKVWLKGSTSEHFMSVSEWNALILRDPKSKSGVRINLRSLEKVEVGYGDGHVKKSSFGGTPCKEPADTCLKISEKTKSGEIKEIVALSFTSTVECATWVAAIGRLIQTTKLWGHRLKDGAPSDL